MGGRRSSGGTERVHRRARTHGGKGEWKAGAFQWGGLNEDAADYPIRKFSLHFDRARRAASNKNYSVLYAIRFPLLRFSSFPRADLSLPISSLSRKMLTRGIEIRAKIDTFDIYHLEGRKVFLSLWNTFVVDIRKGYFKVCRKVEEKRRTRWADEFFLFSGSFFNRQG